MKPEKKTGQNGATAVEFAILLPALLLFIFGILELSLLLFNQQIITTSAREGAREGIELGLDRKDNTLTCKDTDCEGNVICPEHVFKSETVAKQYANNHVITFGNSADPLCVWSTSSGITSGFDLTVTVSYRYDFLVLSAFGLGPINLESVATMKLE